MSDERDPEFDALAKVYRVLAKLDEQARARVLAWLISRLEHDRRSAEAKAAERQGKP